MFRLDPVAAGSNDVNHIIVTMANPSATPVPPPPPPVAGIFFLPQNGSDLSGFTLPTNTFSDAALLLPLTVTTAMITHVTAYASANANKYDCTTPDDLNCTLLDWMQGIDETGLGACGVNYDFPWGSGRDSTTPPAQGTAIADGDCSVSFDPAVDAVPVTSLPPLAYDSGTNTINGIAGDWTVVLNITTDLGDGILVVGTTHCF